MPLNFKELVSKLEGRLIESIDDTKCGLALHLDDQSTLIIEAENEHELYVTFHKEEEDFYYEAY